MSRTKYLLYRDETDAWFIRFGLGMFWECGPRRDEAKEFSTRRIAAAALHKAGKHREGWRVVTEKV